MSQREVGEQGAPNWMLVAVLLVEFAIEGDLGMKDATCQQPNIGNTTQGPIAMLTTFPSLLTCLSFLAGRSIGSLSGPGTSSCPVAPVATSRRAGHRTSCGWSLTAFCLTRPCPRPRPFPTPRALDARPGPALRCSRSSDSKPAGPGSTAAAASIP